jgi:hypothetical protein
MPSQPPRLRAVRTVIAAIALAGGSAGVTWYATAADNTAPPLTAQALIDRAMIEDLVHDYYAQLGSGNHDFSRWFAPDGVLDVNGEVGRGKAGIEKIYADTAARGGAASRSGQFRMLLTNLRIRVNGNTATADMIWTGLDNETVTTTTKLVEQGTEHDELVKLDGRWVFRHRSVISDGGMHPDLLKTYRPRAKR